MDVRLPDGRIVKNVPDGTTKAELMRRLGGLAQAPAFPVQTTQEMRAAPEQSSFDAFREMLGQVKGQAQDIEQETPFLNRPSTQSLARKVAGPLIGAVAGPPGIIASSLLAGGMGAASALADQRVNREPIDVEAAAKEGAVNAAGNAVGGVVIKGLGAVAKKLFASPLDEGGKNAAAFARENGLKFPLSSAVPGTGASVVQTASRGPLLGEIKTQLDANKVAQFLNREVSTITAKGSPIDDAALKGQQFLRQVFEPAETAYTNAFKGFRETVGDSTAIPLTETSKVLQGAADALTKRRATGPLVQQIQGLAKKPPTELTALELDNLYAELLKKAGKNGIARPEMSVVLSALVKDADAVGQQFSISFADEIAKGRAGSEALKELRNIPGLERLAAEFGDRGATGRGSQWLGELFGNPNGKALAEIRRLNPELYHDLSDTWLANNLQRFSRTPEGSIVPMLNGPKLREWYLQNSDKIKLIFGNEQAKALDNFTNYAKYMAGAVERAGPAKSSFSNPTGLVGRAAATAGGSFFGASIALPTEAAAFVLARGLSDPSSTLFRLFTEGVKPGTMKFLETSAKLSGQAGANAYADSR